MKPTDKIWWERISAGVWWAHLYNMERTRYHNFSVERTSKRSWSVYDWSTGKDDWICVLRAGTWAECRIYVEEYFKGWIASDISSRMTIHADRGVKSTSASI